MTIFFNAILIVILYNNMYWKIYLQSRKNWAQQVRYYFHSGQYQDNNNALLLSHGIEQI